MLLLLCYIAGTAGGVVLHCIVAFAVAAVAIAAEMAYLCDIKNHSNSFTANVL